VKDIGAPAAADIVRWRARWTPERTAEVLRILAEDPQWGAKKIAGCVWYAPEEGFGSWQDEDAARHMTLFGWPVLDLRGFVFCDVPLHGARLMGTHAEGAVFLGRISDADFSQAHLAGVNARKAELVRLTLCSADVSGADMAGTMVRGSDLSHCNLRGVDLERATFRDSRLNGATLLGANLKHTGFFSCQLLGCTLRSPQSYAQMDTGTFFGRAWRYSLGRKVLGTALLPFYRRGPHLLKPAALHRFSRRREKTRQVFDQRSLGGLVARERRDVCGEIKLCLRDNGIVHKAAIYYEQEEYWRTRARWDKIHRWKGCLKSGNRIRFGLLCCRLVLAERLMGYGERPGRIVRWSFGVIALCALLFFYLGYEIETPMGLWVPFGLHDHQFSEAGGGVDLARCLLFSIERFTTVGSSILRAAPGFSHAIASFEALVGVLFVALATVTWARKAIRD
jgi:uncharacterized protein YjbI with pentapeptide repeats